MRFVSYINVPPKRPNVEMTVKCQVDQMPYRVMPIKVPSPVLTHRLINHVVFGERE